VPAPAPTPSQTQPPQSLSPPPLPFTHCPNQTKGADCSGVAYFETLPADAGYFAHYSGGKVTPSFYACPGGEEACPGGVAAEEAGGNASGVALQCDAARGYTGEGCLACIDGYYRTGSMACRECSDAVGGSTLTVAVLALLSLTALTVIVRSALTPVLRCAAPTALHAPSALLDSSNVCTPGLIQSLHRMTVTASNDKSSVLSVLFKVCPIHKGTR
jgi:hypothetical protein